MWIILVALGAGVLFGASGRLPERFLAHLDKLTAGTLFIMLAALGAQIGGNSELIANLPVLGWRALVITVMAVAGSVGAVWFVGRSLQKGGEG